MGGITESAGALGEKERAEVDSVLASAAFGRSPRLARLLKYLCDKYFSGAADQIKEYNIAVDVLDRPVSFDPSEDAIARVEVHRLRKKLREYYEAEGADHGIRIVIPAGRYGPVFLADSQAAADEEMLPPSEGEPAPPANGAMVPAPPQPALSPSPLWKYVIYGSLVVAALAAFLVLWPRSRPAVVARTEHPPAVIAKTIPPQPATGTVPIGPVPGPAVRILCGQRQARTDQLGNVWEADRYFEGGEYWERPSVFLARTSEPELFSGARTGSFSYNIPLQPGIYELHLYFAETTFGPGMQAGGGENSRVFHVALSGKRILDGFDIVSDAGGAAVADERVFKDISPGSDGMLHLRFMSDRSQPMVSAIRLQPAPLHRLNPIRIVAQEKSFTDSSGRTWMRDNYWSGGQIGPNSTAVEGVRDPGLFTSERYGNFSYAIPADKGEYSVTLYFAEKFWGLENPGGGGAGTRVFDVLCNGAALLRSLDIYQEAGGNHALLKTFHGLKCNAQGKLWLSFVPVRNYASLYAIEFLDETPQ